MREIANNLIEPQTSSVRITLEVSQRTDTKNLPVSVHVLSPLSWSTDGTWNEYILVPKDPLEWTPNIQITGAREDLDRLNVQDVQAYIVLTDEDKKPIDSYLESKIIVHLPEGLKLNLTGEMPSVQFRLEKRSKPVGTP